ncbi:hypothetical protein SSBR45G_33140 [Bradyrhizobium sp. SSBR45G]|uniref:hypothetical protein n=1 Tax=unclassified Bradyrhizobium TaxID=2631580 RepID=UPI0023429C14|nr:MULTISPECIES: hypothetical protein [unclassified Bradyrhizobium]GLH78405.1 hypothetical protein SSBR45G_33140 [Bradyrhizobium sp. SSBR45G]GLH86188.1 hypothetical protein SSBR45R_36480 [Bradyrhizobium sp. SSBR45R]
MWKTLWRRWTIDKPALLGDWLWDVFVVQLAAFLDRLTLRRIIAFLPVIILGLAYYHSIPIPPELMLVGDILAYIDVYSVLLLLGILSRVTTILFVIRQAIARLGRVTNGFMTVARRLDARHRRARGARIQRRATEASNKDGDDPAIVTGMAWA